MNQVKLDINFNKSPLNEEKLKKFSDEKSHKAYKSNDPFPHIVIENLFDEAILNRVLEEFPDKNKIEWKQHDSPHEKKLASTKEEQLPGFTRYFIHYLNSSTFINFLEELTGIYHLIPDPHLEGGGLHQSLPGGKLGIHSDFNKNPRLKLDRRINLLLYLNKEWEEQYGGHLELWDKEMKNCVQKVLPVFNRTVIFSTTDFAFHGHPEPLTCPEGYSRKSIAMYYYTNGRPQEEISTRHSTLFQLKPGARTKVHLKHVVKKFIPPIVFELKEALARKFL